MKFESAGFAATLADPPASPIDQTLADSFPASDPPSWTPGIARVLAPSAPVKPRVAPRASMPAPDATTTPPAILSEVSSSSSSRIGFFRGLRSVLAMMGLVLLVPFAVLLLGLPIALLVRLIVEAVSLVR